MVESYGLTQARYPTGNLCRNHRGKGNNMKAIDYIRIALAIEVLAYHDKNYLDRALASSNAKISETVQSLLMQAEAALKEW